MLLFSIDLHFGIITAENHRHLPLSYLSLILHQALPIVWLLEQHLQISWQDFIDVFPPLEIVEAVPLIPPAVPVLAL